jgi:hypothetical protein
MIRIRYLQGVFPVLFLALSAASAQAAEDYLKLIPSTALSWGVVNHMSDANAKVQKLAAAVGAPVPGMLDSFKTESGISKGLDEKRAGGFFLLPGTTAKDPVLPVLFVAIEDEKEFLGNFKVVKPGERIKEIKVKVVRPNLPPGAIPPDNEPSSSLTEFVCFRSGYALMTSERFKPALEASLAAKQDISAEMAGFESWLAENDGTVVGTAAGIKYAAKQAAVDLKNPNSAGGSSPELAVFAKSFQENFSKAAMNMPSEFSLALAGIRYDKQGAIHVCGRARLVSGGEFSKAVGDISPSTEKLLSGIPGGSFIIAAGGVGIPKLTDGYHDLVLTVMKSMKSMYGMSAEEIEKMTKESFETFKQVRSMNIVMKTGKRGDPIYSNIYSAMRVEDSQRLLDLQEKYAANTNKLLHNATEGMMKSTSIKRMEIAGKPALQQEVTFDLSSMAGPEANHAALEAMMGAGGKMLLYHVAADQHTVLMGMGVSQERMAAALDIVKQPRKSLAEDADVNLAAAMLPADAQWVLYISPRGYMQMTQRLMSGMMKNVPGGEEFTLPQFPKSPPIGIAIKATPAELEAQIAVPAPLIEATAEYVKEMQKAMVRMMQQQGQPPAPAP